MQRRAPAVLAAWDSENAAWEHYAWGIMPELADRIDRSQADLEQRQIDRAGFLAAMARSDPWTQKRGSASCVRYLATEATRTPSTGPRQPD